MPIALSHIEMQLARSLLCKTETIDADGNTCEVELAELELEQEFAEDEND